MKKILYILIFSLAYQSTAFADQHKAYVDVNGLVCDFCARALEKVFSKQDEVASIDVDLGEKVITIEFKGDQQLEDERISKLVQDSGYSVVAIRRQSGHSNVE